jgi:hypothetical protein
LASVLTLDTVFAREGGPAHPRHLVIATGVDFFGTDAQLDRVFYA